jgi:hypothetical protein
MTLHDRQAPSFFPTFAVAPPLHRRTDHFLPN